MTSREDVNREWEENRFYRTAFKQVLYLAIHGDNEKTYNAAISRLFHECIRCSENPNELYSATWQQVMRMVQAHRNNYNSELNILFDTFTLI